MGEISLGYPLYRVEIIFNNTIFKNDDGMKGWREWGCACQLCVTVMKSLIQVT